jgi:hypothetical protein
MVPGIFLKVLDLGPLPQTPGFIACSQSRGRSQPSRAITKRSAAKKRHSASVLGPGSALRSLPSVALSSVQVSGMITVVKAITNTNELFQVLP